MKARAKPTRRDDLDSAGRRLLEALNQTGAYAWNDEGGPAPLKVVAPRNNVSVQVASFAAIAAEPLISRGLAAWSGSGRPRLSITEAGRSKCARLAAPGSVDPFVAQHSQLESRRILHDDQMHDAMVNAAESPLAWLARRKGRDGRPLVDAAGFEAGERLRRDMTFAQLLPRVTANWSGTGSDPAYHGLSYSDRAIAARQRVDRALAAVGPEFSGLLVDICGFLKGLETIESERGWPARSGKVVLTLALQRLARHYGYGIAATGAASPVRHWGTEDFRPEAGLIDPTPTLAKES